MFKSRKAEFLTGLLRLGVPAIAVVAALLIKQGLEQGLGIVLPLFILFYPAVMIVALFLGLWPGLLATAFAALLSNYFVLPPTGSFKIETASDRISLALFSCICVFIVIISDRYRSARERMAALAGEERYRVAFQTSQDGIVFSRTSDGSFIDVNPTFIKFTGYSAEEVIGRTGEELGIWGDEQNRKKLFEIMSQRSSVRDLEVQFRKKDGSLIWTTFSASPIEIKGEACILSVVHDISQRKRDEEALRSSEARYRAAFQTSIDAIGISRVEDGRYVDVNQALLQMIGCEREEVVGHTSTELNLWGSSLDREKLVSAMQAGDSFENAEIQLRRKSGDTFWAVASASPIEIDGERCVLFVVRDVTEARLAEEAIRNLAFFDPLTGLPNRRLLMEDLRKSLTLSMRSHHKRALMILDLDRFKDLNDALGHQAGDTMLREVAHRITHCIREADTASRVGGDEFVVLLENLNTTAEIAAAEAKTVAEKILASIDTPFQLDGREYVSTCSIGITICGDDGENVDAVFQQADIAMYQAKAAGRNTIRFFAPELQTIVNARAAMEEDLRQAIRDNQFVLFYQPQVGHGRLIGAEALIRWQHPRRGLLSPVDFIPLAEETRLISPIGAWVLGAACRQIAAWADDIRMAEVKIAVNISALEFRRKDFIETVVHAIEAAGANPRNLTLELTESILVENVDDIIAKMTALRSLGLGFSLDDFGTGYSSLSYLKRLPLGQLKIDRSFVRDLLVDDNSLTIAQVIISLSYAMNLPVIAEGVETEEQRKVLEEMGCHTYQGFLFSRPLPVDEFELLQPRFGGDAEGA